MMRGYSHETSIANYSYKLNIVVTGHVKVA